MFILLYAFADFESKDFNTYVEKCETREEVIKSSLSILKEDLDCIGYEEEKEDFIKKNFRKNGEWELMEKGTSTYSKIEILEI